MWTPSPVKVTRLEFRLLSMRFCRGGRKPKSNQLRLDWVPEKRARSQVSAPREKSTKVAHLPTKPAGGTDAPLATFPVRSQLRPTNAVNLAPVFLGLARTGTGLRLAYFFVPANIRNHRMQAGGQVGLEE